MQEYVKYSVVWDNIHVNVKYVLSKMSERDDPDGMEKIKLWKDMEEICEGMGIGDFYRENQKRMREREGGRKREGERRTGRERERVREGEKEREGERGEKERKRERERERRGEKRDRGREERLTLLFQVLLARGRDVNFQATSGETALHLAAVGTVLPSYSK